MAEAYLEHVNVTVSDPEKTAKLLCELFDWRIRWRGDAIHNGRSIHVGGSDSYVVVYSKGEPPADTVDSYSTRGGLNHIAVVVDDLDKIEARVVAAGFETFSHADYEPGRRFYFRDDNDIEFEIVSYAPKPA